MSDQENAVKSAKIPDKFPGETGSFLKEVSTRKLERRPVEDIATVSIPLVGSTIAVPEAQTHQLEQNPILNSKTSNTAATPVKMRLSAYEFYRRLRQSSSSADSSVRHSEQLKLFAVSKCLALC